MSGYAEASGRIDERRAVIRYLRDQLIRDVCGEAEEHFNGSLMSIIDDIERGKHRVHEGGAL